MAPRGISHLFLNETNHIRALTGGEIVKASQIEDLALFPNFVHEIFLSFKLIYVQTFNVACMYSQNSATWILGS